MKKKEKRGNLRGSGFNRAEFDTVRGGEWIKAVRGRRLSRRFLFVS